MILCVFFVFFFFKQKTAYEMRISDWSSDVCSSDLLLVDVSERSVQSTILRVNCFESSIGEREGPALSGLRDPEGSSFFMDIVPSQANRLTETSSCIDKRSEEHTSELQSLMRISYAVFCLKKKNTKTY